MVTRHGTVSQESAPDFVLADVTLPKLDGVTLLRQLRSNPRTRDVPVILLASYADENSCSEGLSVGADDILIKPINAGELLAKVQGHLQLATLKREGRETLQHSEQELDAVFENAPVGLHWLGPDGVILRVNQTELDMLGYSREEFVGQHIANFHVRRSIIDDILARLATGKSDSRLPCRNALQGRLDSRGPDLVQRAV